MLGMRTATRYRQNRMSTSVRNVKTAISPTVENLNATTRLFLPIILFNFLRTLIALQRPVFIVSLSSKQEIPVSTNNKSKQKKMASTTKIGEKSKTSGAQPIPDISNMSLEETDDMPGTEAIRIEAEAAVREISFAVNFVELSKTLQSTDYLVYMNLTTRENENYCVELCLQGFRIVGRRFDCISLDDCSRYYETIYALLDSTSPGYRCSFGEALQHKLAALQDSRAGSESW